MADDLRHVDRVQVVRDYEARFGPEGEFDCWIFDGEVNMRLMLIGLGRGSPITDADLDKVHRELYGTPLPPPPPPGART